MEKEKVAAALDRLSSNREGCAGELGWAGGGGGGVWVVVCVLARLGRAEGLHDYDGRWKMRLRGRWRDEGMGGCM